MFSNSKEYPSCDALDAHSERIGAAALQANSTGGLQVAMDHHGFLVRAMHAFANQHRQFTKIMYTPPTPSPWARLENSPVPFKLQRSPPWLYDAIPSTRQFFGC